MNKKGFAISGMIYAILVLFLILVFSILSILGSRKLTFDKLKKEVVASLNENNNIYDNSGANAPILYDNMIPVKYANNKWVVANTTEKWYDYSNQKWANAVVLNNGTTKSTGDEVTEEDVSLWYVWIPRYKYVIFNGNNESVNEQEISIIFERGTSSTGTVKCVDNTDGSETCTDSTNGSIVNGTSTYTHPAFTFGNTELTGFWVGKFETSTTDSTCNSSPSETNCSKVSTINIKPNVNSWRYNTVSNFFTSIQNVESTYGINNADSHMMKNMEWGAVAYLKQSVYGLGTTDIATNTSEFYTGGGTNDAYKTNVSQSTTGNIYGVYDTDGGAAEYVMGNMVNENNGFFSNLSGFSTTLNSKYYDTYKYDTVSTNSSRGKLGDATKETLKTLDSLYGGWYDDYSAFAINTHPWVQRGGYYNATYLGIFNYSRDDGNIDANVSTRAVLTAKSYTNNSGANSPILYNNMIPIKYESNKWVYADISQKWYDYDLKEWANAVVLNPGTTKSVGDEITESDIALWYVWIPRYKYTIFNGNNESVSEQLINVAFESETNTTGTVKCTNNTDGSETCTDTTNGSVTNGTSTYTHPAFTFGNTELTGFWVGKFEVSGSTSTITVKPNVSSLRNQTVSAFFTAIQNIKTTYSISNADSHMMKNMEWGAVAYLKQSKYGLGTTDIGINNNSSYITGCGAASGSSESTTCNAYNTEVGMLASTTGNIYGVYDMSGGAWEYVMGNMLNSSNEFYSSNADFSTAPASKYYDTYKYDTSNTTHARGKLGDATKETLSTFGSYTGGWYSDYENFPFSSSSWFFRGGVYSDGLAAGVFYFFYYDGYSRSYSSARSVLSAT